MKPVYIDSFTLIKNKENKNITFCGYSEYPSVIIDEEGNEKVVANKDEVISFTVSHEHAKSILKVLDEQVNEK